MANFAVAFFITVVFLSGPASSQAFTYTYQLVASSDGTTGLAFSTGDSASVILFSNSTQDVYYADLKATCEDDCSADPACMGIYIETVIGVSQCNGLSSLGSLVAGPAGFVTESYTKVCSACYLTFKHHSGHMPPIVIEVKRGF